MLTCESEKMRERNRAERTKKKRRARFNTRDCIELLLEIREQAAKGRRELFPMCFLVYSRLLYCIGIANGGQNTDEKGTASHSPVFGCWEITARHDAPMQKKMHCFPSLLVSCSRSPLVIFFYPSVGLKASGVFSRERKRMWKSEEDKKREWERWTG